MTNEQRVFNFQLTEKIATQLINDEFDRRIKTFDAFSSICGGTESSECYPIRYLASQYDKDGNSTLFEFFIHKFGAIVNGNFECLLVATVAIKGENIRYGQWSWELSLDPYNGFNKKKETDLKNFIDFYFRKMKEHADAEGSR